MARFDTARRGPGSAAGGGGGGGRGRRFDDGASYITDTSSITNPVELGFSSSSAEDEDDDDMIGDDNEVVSFVDSATSALTGLTGWTSANGGGFLGGGASASGRSRAGYGSRAGGEVSEPGDSANFPMARSRSNRSGGGGRGGDYHSTATPSAITAPSAFASASAAHGGDMVSAISFDMNEGGSVEASLDPIIEVPSYRSGKSGAGGRSKAGGGGGGRSVGSNGGRAPLTAIPHHGSGAQSSSRPTPPSPRPGAGPAMVRSSSGQSHSSSGSKKRAPVPPLRDPNMEDKEEDQMWEEDCNYDINPTLMFLVLESRNWSEAVSLLDGKGLENKDGAWNLGALFGGGKKDKESADALQKKRQMELRQQARTWIVRRERNGVLRWRMLPIHAALAFNAPFDVVLRLYHLYPGAVRCRNDQGMLPMHHVFKYGNDDKILELLLDVFPEALTVVDDKGRLPLACTPADGSDNERRSNILTLFSNFQVALVKKEMEGGSGASDSSKVGAPSTQEEAQGTLGAAPRYTANADYNAVTYSALKTPQKDAKKLAPPDRQESAQDDDEGSLSDRYAAQDVSDENGENIPLNGRKLGLGLLTIPENETLSPKAREALKSELMVLGKKQRKGIKKLFGKKKTLQVHQ